MKKRIHNAVIKIIVALNLVSLLFWICVIDSICSWEPYVIMIENAVVLFLFAYSNGWIYDTKPYNKREGGNSDVQI